jgi:hypothetical protein
MRENVIPKSMMLVNTEIMLGEKTPTPSFRLISVSKESPYNEAVYHRNFKRLIVYSKEVLDSYEMFRKLDSNGDVERMKNGRRKDNPNTDVKEERKAVRTPYEYHLTNAEDIQAFIDMFAVNPEFDYKSLLEPATTAGPTVPQQPLQEAEAAK